MSCLSGRHAVSPLRESSSCVQAKNLFDCVFQWVLRYFHSALMFNLRNTRDTCRRNAFGAYWLFVARASAAKFGRKTLFSAASKVNVGLRSGQPTRGFAGPSVNGLSEVNQADLLHLGAPSPRTTQETSGQVRRATSRHLTPTLKPLPATLEKKKK